MTCTWVILSSLNVWYDGCGDGIIKVDASGVDGSSVVDGTFKNVCAIRGTSLCTMDFSWGARLTCRYVTPSSQNEGFDQGCGYVHICWCDLGGCDVYNDGIWTL